MDGGTEAVKEMNSLPFEAQGEKSVLPVLASSGVLLGARPVIAERLAFSFRRGGIEAHAVDMRMFCIH